MAKIAASNLRKSTALAIGTPSSGDVDFFGPAPLIPGEDPEAYKALQTRVAAAVAPKDVLEEIWVRDVVDLVWETLRLRRLKAAFLSSAAHEGLAIILRPLAKSDFMRRIGGSLSERWAQGEPEAKKTVNGHLASAGLSVDDVMAQTVALKLEAIERMDRMLASAEGRRDAALRELTRHRETLAAAVRRATEKIDDAEFEEIDHLADVELP
jgi:hypothetical protein